MNIPSNLRAGDTYLWTESNADHPASSGWTLTFALRAKDKAPINIAASPSGNDYAIAITAATSRAWIPGVYFWQAYVYKESGGSITEKYTLANGQIEILPDLTQATSQSDFRSAAKKNLDMIEARLSGDTSPDVMSYSIGGRSLSKRSAEDLIMMRSYWKTEVERELAAEKQSQGSDINPNRIGVRFNRV